MRHRFAIAIILIVGISFVQSRWKVGPWANADASGEMSAAEQIEDAYKAHHSGITVTARGTVERTLADDTAGDRHQRFIVRLPSGVTILVAHNIDAAPRVPGLVAGTAISLHGEYEWNDKGGVVHWTHRDNRSNHENGWIEYNGRRYE